MGNVFTKNEINMYISLYEKLDELVREIFEYINQNDYHILLFNVKEAYFTGFSPDDTNLIITWKENLCKSIFPQTGYLFIPWSKINDWENYIDEQVTTN